MRDSGADAGSSPVNDAPTQPASAPAPEPAGSQRSEDRAAKEPKHRHRALVWALVVLASVVLLVSMIANWVQTQVLDTQPVLQQHRRDPQEQGRPAAAQHLRGRSALRQRRRPGPDPAEAAAPRPAARRTDHSGDETARHERRGNGPRLASSSDSRRHRHQRGAAALRQPDRGQGPVRLDAGRRRHPRIRELRRRPCHSPGRRSLGDLPDPGLHPAVLDGAQAAPDDDPEQDRVHASDALSGAGGHAHPAGATEPDDSRNGCRPAPHDRREPPTEDRGHPAEGPRPASEPAVRPPGPPGQARHTADDRAGTGRRGNQGPEPGEHPQARPHARLAPDARHRPAEPSGGSAPRRARRDEVQRAERAPGPREGAAQPRLRAAGAGAACCTWRPSTSRRAGGGRL